MAENNIPNPSSSLVYFFIVTFIYLFFTIFSLYGSNSVSSVRSNSNNSIYNIIYIILVLIGSYFINLNISKALCDSNSIQWNNIFFITILPWMIIFSVIYFLLELFPGWVSPFSNTIGYFVVNLLGVNKLIGNILNESKDNNKDLVKALVYIKKNYSKFINEIDIDELEFEKFIETLHRENIINTGKTAEEALQDSNILELYKLVNIKHIIGKIVWYILAGILIASITYNFIINITCASTLEETRKEYNKIMQGNEDSEDADESTGYN